MNATAKHPALALFRVELLTAHFHGMPLIGYILQVGAWVMIALLPTALFVLGNSSPRFADAAMYWRAVSAVLLPTMWLGILGWHCPVTLTHRFWELLPASSFEGYNGYEFMVTRAIDRRLHFRIKTAAVAVMVIGPLMVALLLSLFHPDCNFYPDISGLTPRQYADAFPGSHLAGAGSAVARGEWVIKNGALAFNAWMLALGALTLVAAHGYYGLMSRIIVNQSKWAVFGLLILLPLTLLFAILFAFARNLNYGEPLMLWFWSHWPGVAVFILACGWGVLRYCEKRFAELEIL